MPECHLQVWNKSVIPVVTDATCCFVHSLHAAILNALRFLYQRMEETSLRCLWKGRKVSAGNYWAKCNYCYVGFIWLRWPWQKKTIHFQFHISIFGYSNFLYFLALLFIFFKLFLNGEWLPACFSTFFSHIFGISGRLSSIKTHFALHFFHYLLSASWPSLLPKRTTTL